MNHQASATTTSQGQNPAKDWLVLRNTAKTPMVMLIEPWGIGPFVQPNDICRIFLHEESTCLPEVELHGDTVVIFASATIVEANSTITHDFSEKGWELPALP